MNVLVLNRFCMSVTFAIGFGQWAVEHCQLPKLNKLPGKRYIIINKTLRLLIFSNELTEYIYNTLWRLDDELLHNICEESSNLKFCSLKFSAPRTMIIESEKSEYELEYDIFYIIIYILLWKLEMRSIDLSIYILVIRIFQWTSHRQKRRNC